MLSTPLKILSVILLLTAQISAQFQTHQLANRTAIVHLFEWKWPDIAAECERYLAPNGFAGVQISPPNENVAVPSADSMRPWWERYQPLSYRLTTRSGNESQFLDMTRRCNAVGVRIYADVVFNHMTGNISPARGTGGRTADPAGLSYPAVPYAAVDFHPPCGISNYSDAWQVRNCELVGLHDLNQTRPDVRAKIVAFLDRLVELGVAGFRVDAAKHMWPKDLELIYATVRDLNAEHGFAVGARPFIVQEVIDLGGEGVSREEYRDLGVITEFKFSAEIGRAFRGRDGQKLHWLRTWGQQWGFLPADGALVFVDNHDNQRGHGGGGENIINFKEPRLYRMATAFMLGHPYGIVRLMSSFRFTNTDQGPPQTASGEIVSPQIGADGGQCDAAQGWVCEHRWPQIRRMVELRNVVSGTRVHNWWGNGGNQVAFCRGERGFVAINNEAGELNRLLTTCLPEGRYCDVISGSVVGGACSGKEVLVDAKGVAQIVLEGDADDGVLALHVGGSSKLY